MPTFEELRAPAEHRSLMLKFSQLLVFVAPMTADPVTSITDAGGAFKEIPEGYLPVGLLQKDSGVTFPREVSNNDTESVNHSSFTRRDVESDTRRLAFTAQQTTRTTLELAWGLDLSGVTRGANGEVSIQQPPIPTGIRRRVLVLAHDPKFKIAAGKFFPEVEPTDFPEIAWGPSQVTSYSITGDAYTDADLGYPVLDIPVAGPGALEFASAIGFGAPVPPPAWQATTAYLLGATVTIGAGTAECTTAGTSAGTVPTLPGTVGGTVTDGTVVWTRLT